MTHIPHSPLDELERLRAENQKLNVAVNHFEHLGQQLAGLIDQSPILAWIKNTAGEYCYVNERLCKLLGCSADDMLWRTGFEILPTYTALLAQEAEIAALKRSEPVESIEAFVSADGSTTHWRVLRFQVTEPPNAVFIGAIAIRQLNPT
ncbi:MAG: PAS domain S-box protein [Gammaproteobacteria bacterium]|nr:PAS domain S-box protein [Gammaproteobacteria bacterium]